jgi:hypothetical protein
MMTVVADKMIQLLCEHAHDKGWHFWKRERDLKRGEIGRISAN